MTLSTTPPSTRTGSTITSTVSYSFTQQSSLLAFNGPQGGTISGTKVAKRHPPDLCEHLHRHRQFRNTWALAPPPPTRPSSSTPAAAAPCACHYPSPKTATPSRAAGATLRIDAEKAAVYSALSTIPSGSTYQVAIYSMSNQLINVFALSNNITNAMKVVAPISQNASGLNLGRQRQQWRHRCDQQPRGARHDPDGADDVERGHHHSRRRSDARDRPKHRHAHRQFRPELQPQGRRGQQHHQLEFRLLDPLRLADLLRI